MISDVELAWAAGIIDGEGCLFIGRHRASPRHRTRTDSFFCALKVTMGHEPTIRRLRDMFGSGSKHTIEQLGQRGPWNTAYTWLVQADMCSAVLQQIGPYLFTKRDEYHVALRFLALPKWGGGYRRGPKSPEFVLQQEQLWHEMRMLKPRTRLRLEANRGTDSV